MINKIIILLLLGLVLSSCGGADPQQTELWDGDMSCYSVTGEVLFKDHVQVETIHRYVDKNNPDMEVPILDHFYVNRDGKQVTYFSNNSNCIFTRTN